MELSGHLTYDAAISGRYNKVASSNIASLQKQIKKQQIE
jgi:hypothetical protein